MAKTPFDEFVDRKIAESNDLRKTISRDAEITEWQHYLEALYGAIEVYLAPYIGAGKIVVSYQSTQIREELLGQYQVRSMEILIGEDPVRLEPIGTYLIGVKGRVDMIGPRGTVRLVLVDKEASGPRLRVAVRSKGAIAGEQLAPQRTIEWVWKIAVDRERLRYIDLVAESFYSALMETVSG